MTTPISPILIIQPQIGVVVCSPCKVILGNIRCAKAHFQNTVHRIEEAKIRDSIKAIFEEAARKESLQTKKMKDMYEAAPASASGQTKCVPLPFLVGVKAEHGYRCPNCVHHTRTMKNLSDHMKLKHSKEVTDTVVLEKRLSDALKKGSVLVQTLKMGKGTRYFPVCAVDPIIPHLESCWKQKNETDQQRNESAKNHEEFCRLLSDTSTLSSGKFLSTNSPDRRMLNEFINRTRLDKVLIKAGISMETAVMLSGKRLARCSPSVETRFMNLSRLYMKMCPGIIDSLSPSVLTSFSLSSDHPFRAVSQETLGKYADTLGRYVISAYRHMKKGFLKTAHLSLEALISKCEEESFSLEDVSYQFHSAVKELCLVRHNEVEGVDSLFIRSFLACSSVSKHRGVSSEIAFRYCHSYEVSIIAASLQYCISFSALSELWYTGQQLKSDKITSEERRKASDVIERDLLLKLDVHKNTSASYLRFILNICNYQNRNRKTDICFVKCDMHPLCGFLNGVELSMEDLGRFLRKLQSQARDIIQKHLLLDGAYPSQHEAILDSFQDDIADHRTGYSFMEHRLNKPKMIKLSVDILETIGKNNTGPHPLFCETSENPEEDIEILKMGGFLLYRKGVEQWLRKAQELQETLLVCLHVSSGSPGRATELGTYTLTNTPLNDRNIYVIQKRIYVLCRYTKQCELRGRSKSVLRLPDEETSNLLKQYFVFFRKIEAKFVSLLHGRELERPHLENVFVNRGKRCSPERIRRIFGQKLRGEGKDIGISGYRNYSASMVRLIARRSCSSIEELIDEYACTGHEQAGHSMATADNIYGRSSSDLRNLPAEDVNRYKAWAADYHRALFQWEGEKVHDDFEASNLRMEGMKTLELKEDGQIEYLGTVTRQLGIFTEKVTQLGKKVELLPGKRSFECCESDVFNRSDCRVVKKCKYEIAERDFSFVSPPRRNAEKDATILLPQLREMMKDESAMFRSQMQADVCATMLESNDDLLVIAGTGFGKTVCFMLPIFIVGPKHCAILILPLAALVDEMMSRCAAYGIPASMWRDRNHAKAQVIVCSAEQVGSDDFKVFVRTMLIENRLKWLIFDEVHLASLWEDFREKLRDLRYGLSCVPKRVKRALFTATVSKPDREKLLDAHGISHAILFTGDTSRKNLHLSIRVVKAGARHGIGESSFTKELLLMFAEKQSLADRIMVFVMTKQDVETVAQKLRNFPEIRKGGTVLEYHGGMSKDKKEKAYKVWTSPQDYNAKKPYIIVCTSALGAGVDIADVREVYHLGGSTSLVQYAQEIGRAGRDGEIGRCTLLYSQEFADSHDALLRQKIQESDVFNRRKYEEEKLLLWNEFTTWASDSHVCLKSSLYDKIDGSTCALCIYDEDTVNCEFCERCLQGSAKRSSILKNPAAEDDEMSRVLSTETSSARIGEEAVKQGKRIMNDNEVGIVKSSSPRISDGAKAVKGSSQYPKSPEDLWLLYESLSRTFEYAYLA